MLDSRCFASPRELFFFFFENFSQLFEKRDNCFTIHFLQKLIDTLHFTLYVKTLSTIFVFISIDIDHVF